MIKKTKICGKNDGQMILLAGITISVLIVVLASVPIYLSNTSVSVSYDENAGSLSEYLNVREIFIKTFNESCAGYNDTEVIYYKFNFTEKTIKDIELKYGNYFEADILAVSELKTNYLNVAANFKLICENTKIEEKINIPVWVTA